MLKESCPTIKLPLLTHSWNNRLDQLEQIRRLTVGVQGSSNLSEEKKSVQIHLHRMSDIMKKKIIVNFQKLSIYKGHFY